MRKGRPASAAPRCMALAVPSRGGSNDVTVREAIWRRFAGDEWAAYDALPPTVRRRMQEHAYDAWAVNALVLWKMFRRQTGSGARAERRLLRHLDRCEALERAAFADAFAQAHGGARLPHVAAGASVLRRARRPTGPEASPCAGPHPGVRVQTAGLGHSAWMGAVRRRGPGSPAPMPRWTRPAGRCGLPEARAGIGVFARQPGGQPFPTTHRGESAAPAVSEAHPPARIRRTARAVARG